MWLLGYLAFWVVRFLRIELHGPFETELRGSLEIELHGSFETELRGSLISKFLGAHSSFFPWEGASSFNVGPWRIGTDCVPSQGVPSFFINNCLPLRVYAIRRSRFHFYLR